MRPHEQEQPAKRQLYLAYCLAMAILLAGGAALALCAFFFVGRLRAEPSAADQPLCQAVLNAQWPAEIEGVEWVGYPQKWDGVPLSTFDQEPVLLPLGEWSDGAYALYSLDDGSIFIVPMYTLLDNTPDMHSACPDAVSWRP